MPKTCYSAPPSGAIAFTANELCFLARRGRDWYAKAKKAGAFEVIPSGNRDLIPVASAYKFLASIGLEINHVDRT